MKVERSGVAPGMAGVRRSQKTASAEDRAGPGHVVSDSAEVLGIPAGELRPKVRAALMGLMAEVARLREDLSRARGRIDLLEKLADQDSLLPIYNRRAFVRQLTRAISMTERYGTPNSIVYCDVNGMKQINDTLGHGAGDVALQRIAEQLRTCVRESDIVGRLGGDEFGVILFSADADAAHTKATTLAEKVESDPLIYDETVVRLTITFGTYTFTGKKDP
jgi:diguanylate cyclase (GGDEF)-like protein